MTSTPLAALRWLAVSAAAVAMAAFHSAPALASTGLAELPPSSVSGPVAVFYPSASATQTVTREAFTLNVAPDGVPQRGNGRLIVMSHGTGSLPWVFTDLAHHLVKAGFIVAIPQHSGDNRHDTSKLGPPSWRLRPQEISNAIDAIAREHRFAPLVDLDKVGMWGFSAGGHTALTLAGGRWSAARLRDHCNAHIADDFAACTGGAATLTGGMLDGVKKSVALTIIGWEMADADMQGHTDPRIKAIVSAAPWAANFDSASLAAPPVPLGLIQAGRDVWLVPRFHVGAIAAACKTCEMLANMPNAAHGALMSPFPPAMPERLKRLTGDPAEFNRAVEIPALNARTTAFFQQHLLGPAPKP